jgi:hypothetical protein
MNEVPATVKWLKDRFSLDSAILYADGVLKYWRSSDNHYPHRDWHVRLWKYVYLNLMCEKMGY